MEKNRDTVVGVYGNNMGDYKRVKHVTEELDKVTGVNAKCLALDLNYLSRETGWIATAFEQVIESIDGVDAMLLVCSEYQDSTLWIMGYCWSIGKPVILWTEDNVDDFPVSIASLQSKTAHLHGWDELKEYDYKGLPFKGYKGNFKKKLHELTKGELGAM